MDDLDHAIATNKQTIESTPIDHRNRAVYLSDLGKALSGRFERTGSMDDLDRAIAAKEQTAESDMTQPFIRIKAAQSCSDLLISQRYYSRAKPILQTTIQLLPSISPRHLKRNDQQFNISQFINIVSRAVSLSLADAFLITTDEIRFINLSLLSSDIVPDFAEQFLNAIKETDPTQYRQAMRQMKSVLKGFWDVAVKPVLNELGFTHTPPYGETWPRVWWVGSGLLSVLPIHASGYHNSTPPQSALIVSSHHMHLLSNH